jgi:hypothetical protein
VNDVLPWLEQGRVDPGIVMELQRAAPRVGRGNEPEAAAPLRSADPPLVSRGLERDRRAAQPDLEHVCPVGPRRVRLAVAGSKRHDDALELARVDRARVAHRVLVVDRALANVGDDLGLLGCVARDIAARRKTILVDRLDRSKAIGPILEESTPKRASRSG